ncbi:MAG: hypothetical protein WBD50_07775 [Candidatus Rhabdochlamydia sp.]
MSTLLQFPPLDFWSRWRLTGGEQNKPIKLEIIQKTDEAFTLTISQNDSGFTEDPKILENLGFFKEFSFLDDLKDGASIEEELKTPDATNYTKQDDVINGFKINPRQIIDNSCGNGQNNNSSTKKTSPIRRSKRIAERNLSVKESSSGSIETPISKKRKDLLHLNYGPQLKKQKVRV